MRPVAIWPAAGGILLFAGAASATIIHVPGDQPTIQYGILAAWDGDTVLVADGLYTGDGNRDIDFNGRNIVVMSENGPAVTIIDLQGSIEDPHRGFLFTHGEDTTAVLKGFTIRNGYAYGGWPESLGGAIYCSSSSPKIVENRITGNTACNSGGGIYCREGRAKIRDNAITENRSYGSGGGIYCRNYPPPAIERNTISDNVASGGGGVHCYQCWTTIKFNTITGNVATDGPGGGILNSSSALTVRENVISGNQATGGGGICCLDATNSSQIERNLIAQNVVSDGGGGVLCEYSAATIDGNTMAGNQAAFGAGISCERNAQISVANSILWADEAGTDPEIHVEEGASATVSYSAVAGGWVGVGNIGGDPLFVTGPEGEYYLSQTEAGQVQQSPCVNAADPASPSGDGTTRTDHVCDAWRLDMGFHYPGCIVGVADDYEVESVGASCRLAQNYPNPFGDATTIPYSVPGPGPVRVGIYDIRGALVRILASDVASAGWHRIIWDGRNRQGRKVSSGVYFCRLEAGEYRETRRMVVLR